MILTSAEITQLGIVHGAREGAMQRTTYNATVREILSQGRLITAPKFKLPPRGIVWVVSNEEFALPENVTGLATLRTTWTHDGILALNVGIIDPGWHGPLAAALVNFTNKTFVVKKNEQFLRVIFHNHQPTGAPVKRKEMDEYVGDMQQKSARTANTFLDLKALSREVIDEVFTVPRWTAKWTKWGLAIAVGGVLAALVAIFVPIAWEVSKDWFAWHTKVEQLQRDVDALKKHDHVT